MVERAINLLLSEVRGVLGSKGLIEDPAAIAPWLVDWRGVYSGTSAAILAPASTADVATIVGAAARHGVPLVPQGGNTSMVGGATPPADGSSVILSMRRMNAIRRVDPDANIAVAEAGVILQTLHEKMAGVGRRFPLTLGAKGSATIGGLTSTNAGGTQVLRFGTMRSLVLGIEAVWPNGSIHNGLSVLKKDNRGYDLNQLLVGAEGTLGVITAVALKLVPGVADSATAWIGVDGPQAALALLRFLEARSGEAIESFELMPADSLGLVLQHLPGTRPPLARPSPWNVLIDFVDADAAVTAETLIGQALNEGRANDAVVARSMAQAEAFWRLRDGISEAERAAGPAVQHDISIPVDAMPHFMISAAAAVERAFPVVASAFGHLGDGNVHFHVRAKGAADPESWRSEIGRPASRMVHDLVTDAGGSISAEHGIGQMKRAELLRLAPPSKIAALRAIKAALDPLGIMNPGKLIPLASDGVAQ